jgi:hypothetical protein
VAHAASNGAVRIPNGAKALRLQPQFSELRFTMGATVYARIQINEEHVLDVVKRANGIGFHMY